MATIINNQRHSNNCQGCDVIGVIMNLWDNKGKEIKKGFKDFTKRA
jgi:tRNA U34 2-thiouridine synthase MnmA/TrmU